MADVPATISLALDASNDKDIDSKRQASADQGTPTEEQPLISLKSTSDGKIETDVKIAALEDPQRFKWTLALVVIGQVLLLGLSWGFFAAVRARGQIALDIVTAEALQHYPRATTYMFTLIATGLATFSSYLLSLAVRDAIAVCLKQPTPLSRLDFGISISRQSLIYDRHALWWVLAAAVFSVATIQQTSSWSSLLPPVNIQFTTPLEGTELDVTTDAFHSQFDQLWLNTSSLYPFLDSALLSIVDTSGSTRANTAAGYPGVVSFADYTYWYSTGGTIPIVLEFNIASGSLPPLVTSNTKRLPAFYTSFNASMGQQGMTALVSCQMQDLDLESDPPLSYSITPANITLYNQTYTIFQIGTTCLGEPTSSVPAISPGNNTLSAVVCPSTYQPGTVTYTIIVVGRGIYDYEDGTLVCQVTPRIQNMITSYFNVDSSTYVYSTPDPNDPPSQGDAGGMGWAAMWGLDAAIQYGQSPFQSHVGDSIVSIYEDQHLDRPLSYPALWEEYIQGAVEFVGTALKYQLSAPSGPLSGTPPDNMLRKINGTVVTATFGWEYDTGGILLLLPITFVAVASILIVLFVLSQNRGMVAIRHADFDPGDPMFLIAAASAGGIEATFAGLGKDSVEIGRKEKVTLAQFVKKDRSGENLPPRDGFLTWTGEVKGGASS
ncbi:hypothetical protein B0H11DRAFT_2049245 [Mycena galericulata]|nr:hypothetical protein B0H11DRAFT_2049245 [Mycena galericulata]